MLTTFNTYERGESRIILPLNLNSVHNDSQGKIAALLLNADTGGYTKTYGQGGWREDDHETPIAIYDVAGLSFDTLHECAKVILASGETDVYVRFLDGTSGWFNKETESPADTLAGSYYEGDDRDWPVISTATGANAEFANIEHREKLHGTRDTGWPHIDEATAQARYDRSLRLLVWAAKCHVHQQYTQLPLGVLIHGSEEVQAAIDSIEAVIGKPVRATDEGVRAYNRK